MKLLWLMGLALLVGGCGLAGDVEIVATFTPPAVRTSENTDTGYPSRLPNLQNGATLFAARCSTCHGELGNGQGELVLSGQVPAMQSFLDGEHVRTKRPDEYFSIITNGNLEKLMPPWRDALSEQERWDVALYAYTLHYTEEKLAQGEALYNATCAECHAPNGGGEGETMLEHGTMAYPLNNFAEMVYIGDNALYTAVAEGKGDIMPAMLGDLTEAEIWAVATYVRYRFTVSDEALVDAPTQTLARVGDTVTIRGRVQHGTAGETLPEGLVVNVRYGNAQVGLNELTTPLNADGTYQVDGVPVVADAGYLALVRVDGRIFTSDIIVGEQMNPTTELPIMVYALTDDPQAVRITAISTIIEPFPEMEGLANNGLLFRQVFTYENTSDKLYIITRDGVEVSVLIQLPVGAIALNVARDPRFIVSQDQYAVLDTQPIPPAESQIELIYFVPYENGAIIDQPLNSAFAGKATLVVSPKTLRVAGDAWTLVSDDAPLVRVYEGTFDLKARETLVFELVGSATNASQLNTPIISGDAVLPLLLIVIGFAVLAFAGFLAVRGRRTT